VAMTRVRKGTYSGRLGSYVPPAAGDCRRSLARVDALNRRNPLDFKQWVALPP